MATIKGLTLKIDGDTTSLTSALSGVNKTTKDLQGELREIDRLLKVDPTNTELLAQRQKVLTENIGETNKKLEVLREAARQAQDQLERGEISEEQYRALQREVTKTEQSLNKLEGQASDTGNDLDKAGDEAEKAGKEADSSSGGWSKLGNGLKTVGGLAAKAVAGLGAAAGAAGGAMVGAAASGAAFADDILTLSTQTGIGTDKLQEYKYAAELVDVPLETLTKSLAKNTKSMLSAQQGSKNFASAYEKLGVQVTNADGSLRDGQEVYWEIIDALGKMENETERDALAMQLLGKSAQELNPLIEAGAGRIDELGQKARDAGYVMSGETLDSFGALDDQIQYLKVGAEGAKNAMGTVLLPMLTTLATDGVDLLGTFTNGIQSANGDIGQMATVVSDMIQQVVDKLIEYLPQLIDSGLQILGAIGSGILNNLPTIIDTAVQLVQAILSGIVTALPLLIDGAVQLITQLAQGLADSIPVLLPAVLDAIMFLVESLIENAPALLDAALEIITALAMGLIEYIPVLAERLPEIITAIVNFISESYPKIIETAVTIIGALIKGLLQAIPALVESLPEIISAIANGLLSGIPNIMDVGKHIIEGLWEGIKGMGSWIGEKVSGFFGGIVDGVKGVLGIHSPSKVFAGIGGNMAAGLGEGFTASMKRVTRDIQNAIPTDLEGTINYSVARLTPQAAPVPGSGIDTAAIINALGTMLTGIGGGGNGDLTVVIPVNGVELARATIKDFRSVSEQSPEMMGDF